MPIEKLKELQVGLVYLFGSRACGQANERSDYDFAVLLSPNLSKEERFELRLQLIGLFSQLTKKNVDVVVFNDLASLFFQYVIIREGALLYQKSEEERIEFEERLLSRYFDFEPFLDQYNRQYVKANV